MNNGIMLLSIQYAEVAKSIATGDERMIQNIGNLINQQNSVIKKNNRYWNRIKYRFQGIENKPDPPAIADIEALIQRQSEIRIDKLTNFLKIQYNDFLKQWVERKSIFQKYVSDELSRAIDEINSSIVESFNRFTPLIENISIKMAATNQNLLALGNTVENEEEKTRK